MNNFIERVDDSRFFDEDQRSDLSKKEENIYYWNNIDSLINEFIIEKDNKEEKHE